MYLNLVEDLLWVQDVVGSNPPTPTEVQVTPRRRRLVGQLVVLVPTLFTSFMLGRAHVPTVQRLAVSLSVGIIAIFGVGIWLRGKGE